ncbi:glycosyltransferase family 4 protein [Microbaculum marinum]|uniref:Glycosyltransferase family 4 protein n=1 Tax=Microbaculum marinum TaxID=1764581 RepID=A0AAW9RVB4_9HYPH
MTKTVHVAAQFLSPGSGGIARCARLTLLALRKDTSVAGAFAVQDTEATTIAGVETRPFSGRRLPFLAAHTAHAMGSDLVFYDFPGTARAHRLLALAKKPYALWVHGWEVWRENLRPDYADAIRRADAVFVNSNHTLSRLNESIPGLHNLQVCWLGTERDIDGAGRMPPTSGNEKIVLFVGRNDELFDKGQDVLIDVWPKVVGRVPEAKLCFVGGGSELERLRSLVSASPVRDTIRVLGYLPDGAVSELYMRARLFAMISRVEGFGLVFAEAMSYGVPVLTSLEDASQEVNRDGVTGYSVSRSDPDLLVEQIVDILADDGLHDRLSRGAFQHWADNFSFTAFADRFRQAAGRARLL